LRLLVPRHGGVSDGGAANAYGSSNGRDLWRRAAAAPSAASAPAPPAAAQAEVAALGVAACAQPGSARLCAFGSGGLVGDASAGPPRGPARRRAPAGVAAQAALLVTQALPQDYAVYALDGFIVRLPFVEPPPSRRKCTDRGTEPGQYKQMYLAPRMPRIMEPAPQLPRH